MSPLAWPPSPPRRELRHHPRDSATGMFPISTRAASRFVRHVSIANGGPFFRLARFIRRRSLAGPIFLFKRLRLFFGPRFASLDRRETFDAREAAD